jgi:hypothetical protein
MGKRVSWTDSEVLGRKKNVKAQLHSKQSSIVKTVKVSTYSVNDKHSNEDNEKTFHRIFKVEDTD